MKLEGVFKKKMLLASSLAMSAVIIHCSTLIDYSAFAIPALCILTAISWLFNEELFICKQFNTDWKNKMLVNKIEEMMNTKPAILELEDDLETATNIITNAFWNTFLYVSLFLGSIGVFIQRLPHEDLLFSYDLGVMMGLSLCSIVVYFEIACKTSWTKRNLIRILDHGKTDLV